MIFLDFVYQLETLGFFIIPSRRLRRGDWENQKKKKHNWVWLKIEYHNSWMVTKHKSVAGTILNFDPRPRLKIRLTDAGFTVQVLPRRLFLTHRSCHRLRAVRRWARYGGDPTVHPTRVHLRLPNKETQVGIPRELSSWGG